MKQKETSNGHSVQLGGAKMRPKMAGIIDPATWDFPVMLQKEQVVFR